MPPDRGSEDILVARAQRGDTEAFRELYQANASGVFALVRSLVAEPELAEDVLQETFVRAWERLPKLRGAGAFKVWLRQIARRQAIDALRARRARPSVPLDEDDPAHEPAASDNPEGDVGRSAMAEDVRRAVDALPEAQRQVVVLHHLDGMDVKDVAAVLGMPLGTVLSRLARGREALKRRLAGLARNGW